MGVLIADAMLESVKSQGVQIAIQNGGGIRASLDTGEVTMGEILTILPFQNTLSTFRFSGATFLAALENGVSQVEEGAFHRWRALPMHSTLRARLVNA